MACSLFEERVALKQFHHLVSRDLSIFAQFCKNSNNLLVRNSLRGPDVVDYALETIHLDKPVACSMDDLLLEAGRDFLCVTADKEKETQAVARVSIIRTVERAKE